MAVYTGQYIISRMLAKLVLFRTHVLYSSTREVQESGAPSLKHSPLGGGRMKHQEACYTNGAFV